MHQLTEAELQTKISTIDTMLEIDDSIIGIPVKEYRFVYT